MNTNCKVNKPVKLQTLCMCTISHFFLACNFFIPQVASYCPSILTQFISQTKHHLYHYYAVSIQLAQARPHNTLYLD